MVFDECTDIERKHTDIQQGGARRTNDEHDTAQTTRLAGLHGA